MKRDIVDVESLKHLVDTFYLLAARDNLLKPIFEDLADPDLYKEDLYKYWNEALLNDGTTSENQFPRHIELMGSRRHFIRWLTIFLQSIDGLYAGPNAERAKVIVIRKSEQFQTCLGLSRF